MLMRLSESIPPGECASTHSCTHTAHEPSLPTVRVYRPREYNILFFLHIRPVGGSPHCYLLWLRLFKLRALSAVDGAIIIEPQQSLQRAACTVSSWQQNWRLAKSIRAKESRIKKKQELLLKHQWRFTLYWIMYVSYFHAEFKELCKFKITIKVTI